MGMFANHADVFHPTDEWKLGDCTACSNTGWVDYPISVGTQEVEQDLCPYGCIPVEYREGYYTDFEDEVVIEVELLDALYKSKRPVAEVDPFLILSKAAKKAGIKPYTLPKIRKRAGKVSSDIDLMGLLEGDLHKTGDGLLVTECTVPAYLAGKPVSYAEKAGILRVQYEYMGSQVVVRFGPLEVEHMRFAYSWDNDFSTHQVLG